MILIAGLGNIGTEYNNTRHNLGFIAIDKIQEDYDFPEFKEKNKYLFSKKNIEDTDVIIAKPTTYMNLSGEAILSLSSMYKIPPENIIIIHDDLDLKTAQTKIKQGGGTGGHNGLKSIDSKIGQNYHRIRIGIDHPKNINPNIDVASYVLGHLTSEETKLFKNTIKHISENFKNIIKKEFKI